MMNTKSIIIQYQNTNEKEKLVKYMIMRHQRVKIKQFKMLIEVEMYFN